MCCGSLRRQCQEFFGDSAEKSEVNQGLAQPVRPVEKITHKNDLRSLQVDVKRIVHDGPEKLTNNGADIILMCIFLDAFGPLQQFADVEQDCRIQTIDVLAVPGQDTPAAQFCHPVQSGAVGTVVIEAPGKSVEIEVEQRGLKYAAQQGIASDGPIAPEVDEITLRMTGTAQKRKT